MIISLSLLACGGESKTTGDAAAAANEAAAKADYKGMELVNLSEFAVNANIQLPDQDKGALQIQNSTTESIEILVGDAFGIEIIPFGISVAEKQQELNDDLVYTIEYLEETPEKIVYRKTIKDSEIDPEYHFFITKEINGEPFSIKSLNKAYTQKSIEKMVLSAESLTPQNPS